MKSSRISTALVISFLLTLTLLNSNAGATGGANWPQWRGPDGQGVSTETGLPTEWSDAKNVKWKTAIASAVIHRRLSGGSARTQTDHVHGVARSLRG